MNQEKIMRKIRGLLAQAEDASATPAEAEAFSRKAEELITKHAVDMALIDEATSDRGKPTMRRYEPQAPYYKAKVGLIAGIARAHGARVVGHNNGKAGYTVIGFSRDLDLIEMLFASLLIQGTNAVLNSPHGGKSFRASFWYAYAARVSTRLAENRATVERDADTPGTGLVLASRQAEVETFMADEFPRLRTMAAGKATSAAGMHAGRDAANRADLGGQRITGGRQALAPA